MKIEKILTLTTLAISLSSGAAFAADTANLMICPSESVVSNMFANSWEANPSRSNYFSYAALMVNNHRMVGALHTYANAMPSDSNPHLSFSKVVVHPYVPERGTKQIDCMYTIGNSEVTDLDDGYLHMTAEFVPN